MASGLGIDLGSGAIKAVRMRKRGGAWEVLRAFRMADPAPPAKHPAKPSEPLPPRELAAGLRTALAAAGLSGAGALGITGRDLMVKYVATPPVPPWKLRLMMDLEIKGTAGAEVCGDYAKLNIPGDLTREMVSLVAVAKTSYVESQMALAKRLGLGAEWCCPNAVALFNAFVSSAQFRPGETAAILDIGRENLELVIQRDGVLYFARSASGAGRRFTDAVDGVFNLGYERAEQYKCARAAIHSGDPAQLEPGQLKVSGALREVADGLVAALRSAVMFCKAQAKISKLDIERLVLSGGGARLRGLPEYLKSRLNVPVDLLDPASRLDISRLPRDQQALFEGPGAGDMSVAVGLAQAAADDSTFRVAVLPDRVIKSRRFWRGTAWAIGAAAGLVGILALDYVAATKREQAASDRTEEVKKKLAVLEGGAKKVKDEAAVTAEMKSRAELIEGPAQRNRPVLGFLALLREATPPGVTLEKLSAAGPGEDAKTSLDQVVVKVSGRVDPAAIKPGAPATTEEVYDTLKAYVLGAIRKERPETGFRVADAKLTTQQSELERPAAGDRRIPFTFEVRLATLGVAVENIPDLEAPGPGGPGKSLIPRVPGPPPPTEVPAEPGGAKEPAPPAADGAGAEGGKAP